jgi:prophage regulatory protein
MTSPQLTGRKARAGRAAPSRPAGQRRIINNEVKNAPTPANDDDAELDQQQAGAKNAKDVGEHAPHQLHKVEDLSTTVAAGALVRSGSRPSPYSVRAPPTAMPATSLRLVSYRELKLRGIPYSRSHLRRLEATGQFPRHVTLGEGLGALIAWSEQEVDNWVAKKMARRMSAGPAANISCP